MKVFTETQLKHYLVELSALLVRNIQIMLNEIETSLLKDNSIENDRISVFQALGTLKLPKMHICAISFNRHIYANTKCRIG